MLIMQAKDISTEEILTAISWLSDIQGHWVLRWQLETLWPNCPEKVMLAKIHALLRQDLITGCDCGCRGDLELTTKGYERIKSFSWALTQEQLEAALSFAGGPGPEAIRESIEEWLKAK